MRFCAFPVCRLGLLAWAMSGCLPAKGAQPVTVETASATENPATALACPPLTAAPVQVRRDGNQVVVETGGTARVQLTVVAPDAVRVWAEPEGQFDPAPSFSVEQTAWPPVPFTLCGQRDYLQLLTDEISVRLYPSPLRVDFYRADNETLISAEVSGGGMQWESATDAVSLARVLGDDERIYGLGQDNDAPLGQLNRRGDRRDLWTGQEINSGRVTADIPIAFFMSTGRQGSGYGMFFDNSYRSEFDLGHTTAQQLSWHAEGGPLLYYFFYGPSFKKILNRYTELTGRPSLPPLWALGYIQSKCTYYSWPEIDAVVDRMRASQIPLDVVVIDYDWPEELQNFQWHKRWEGQSPAKISAYEDQGIKFLLSNSGPMIRKDSSNYEDGLAQGVFATDGAGATVVCGHYGGDLLDFTAPNMKSWLWPQMQHLYDEGIDGWWLDLTEPEGEPAQTVYHGGPRAKIHNVYSLLATKTYYEMQKEYAPRTRPFILTRTGSAGIQKYGAAIWTGDIHSDYATLQAHCPEALNAGLSGISMWTNDTGGFLEGYYRNNLEAHGLLYERWLQFSTFSPLTRSHHVGLSEPYQFGEAIEENARKYLQLRYRLLPYIYSHFWETYNTGAPLMRALVFEYQDDPEVFGLQDQYLFGRDLLVAPVLKEARQSRAVYFPEGEWIDYDYGYAYAGNTWRQVEANQHRIPLFVRAGAIIPMAPPMLYTSEKAWDPITLDIYPKGRSRFVMYQDDGETTDFETEHAYTETTLTADDTDGSSLEISIEESNKLFTPQEYRLRVHLVFRPTGVSVDGEGLVELTSLEALAAGAQGWSFDQESRTLEVKLATTERRSYQVHVALDAIPLSRPEAPELPLEDPDAPEVVLPEVATQMPYFFPPPTLPGRVEAENYDRGGAEVAYFDATEGNSGGEYRDDDVDLVQVTDTGGGSAITAIEPGEWVEYTVEVTEPAAYGIELRVRSNPEGTAGRLRLEFDGRDLTGPIEVPSPEGVPQWVSLQLPPLSLRADQQVMRLFFEEGGFELNYLAFTISADACTDIPPDNRYTCAEQASWGKCDEPWMVGLCNQSCGRCLPAESSPP